MSTSQISPEPVEPADVSRAAKVAVSAMIAGLVVVPSVWLIHSLGVAGELLKAYDSGAEDVLREVHPETAQARKLSEERQAQRRQAEREREREERERGKQNAASAAASKAAQPGSGAAAPQLQPEPPWTAPTTRAAKDIAAAVSVQQSDPAQSRALLMRALHAEPKNERALRMLASKLLVDENLPLAQELSQRCLAVNPTNPICGKVRDEARTPTPEQQKQLAVLERCSEQGNDRHACLLTKVGIAFMRGDRAAASRALDAIEKADRQSPIVRLGRARLKAASGRYGEARALLETACAQGEASACLRAEILRGEGF